MALFQRHACTRWLFDLEAQCMKKLCWWCLMVWCCLKRSEVSTTLAVAERIVTAGSVKNNLLKWILWNQLNNEYTINSLQCLHTRVRVYLTVWDLNGGSVDALSRAFKLKHEDGSNVLWVFLTWSTCGRIWADSGMYLHVSIFRLRSAAIMPQRLYSCKILFVSKHTLHWTIDNNNK